MTTTCTLCDLPTPDPPVTDDGVAGAFCCRGCLAVARTLDDAETADPEAAGATPRDVLETGPGTEGEKANEDASGETAFLAVAGMHCATCEAFVEARATDHEGVRAAAASYPDGTVKLVYDPDALDREDLPGLVEGVGYRARERDAAPEDEDESVGRLLVGGFFGMMAMLWYALFLYPVYLGVAPDRLLLDVSGVAGTYLLLNLWVMATVVLGYTGYPILRGAYVSLRAGRPNMDLLVALAASTAYVYSAALVLLGGTEVYFDVAVVIVLAVTVGNHYEDRVRRRAAATLTDLTQERVDEARRRTAGGVETVPVEDLAGGDEVVVRGDERVPVDGEVVEGRATVDESLVTGESLPVRAEPGDEVVGGARVADGGLVVSVAPDATSTLDRLVDLLWEVRSARPGAQRLADRLAAVFVPLVVALAVGAIAVHLLLGAPLPGAVLTGLAVLVVSCPCALGLATPLAVAAGVREALNEGIVVTDASAFERAPAAATVAFDKTGTLTTGEMRLLDHAGGEAVLRRAAAVEQFADHPLAEAVTDAVAPSGAVAPSDAVAPSGAVALSGAGVTDFTTHPGRGVSARVDGDEVVVGRRDLFDERGWAVPENLRTRCERARAAGRVPALVGWAGRARGVVVAGDEPRPEWRRVVSEFDDRRVVVLTGDDDRATAQFRDHPAVDEVFAGVPPEAKAEVVDRLRADGPVAMVGDGSNDAPALAVADVGIALERGTRLAADAADAVVATDDLAAVPRVFEFTAATNRRIRENLAWAFLYNAVAVPLAVAGLVNPLFAAVAMAASSLLVVGNSARSMATSRVGGRDGSGSASDAAPLAERTGGTNVTEVTEA